MEFHAFVAQRAKIPLDDFMRVMPVLVEMHEDESGRWVLDRWDVPGAEEPTPAELEEARRAPAEKDDGGGT